VRPVLLDDGTLLVPRRGEAEDGAIGDVLAELGEGGPSDEELADS
jgi:hypothetical protein